MNQRALLMTCAVGALTLSSGGAYAAAAAPADASQNATSVSEVIVTAEKRSANIQDVPETVTAFTAKDRALKGINTVQDMTNFTPGFTYSSQLDRPAMRGLARNNNIYLSDSSVAVYYDDFFSNSTFFVGRDDMLIDQVEILIGPQGTLYGRNAIGGLINTISRRPTAEPSAEVRAIYGNYNYSKVEGTVSGPIMGNLSFRVSLVDTNQTRGWLKNVAPGGQPGEGGIVHDPYVDAQLQYKDDKNEAWLDFYQIAFHNDAGGPGALLGVPTAGTYAAGTVVAGNIFFNPTAATNGTGQPITNVVGGVGPNPSATNLRDYASAFPTTINVDEAYNLVFHYTHHFDGFDIKYVGGYAQYHYNLNTSLFGNDNSSVTSYQIPLSPGGLCSFVPGCGPLTVNPVQDFSYETHTRWYSNEVTISSTTNSPLQYIAGLYAYTEMDNNLITVRAPDQASIASPTPTIGPAIADPHRYYYFTDYEDRIDSRAIYGQLDWKVTPTLKLTGGLRFTYDQKSGTEQARFINFADLGAGLGIPGTAPSTSNPLGCSTYALFSSLGAGADACVNAGNLGTLFPTLDITPALISFDNSAKGVTCNVSEVLTGYYAGDYQRCLGDHSSALTGTAGIEWTPDKETLVYLRYNRGYKALGLNAGVISRNPEAAPEHVNDYEIGFKKTFGYSFTLDADAFYYDYSNDQVPLDVPTGGINLTQFLNVPKALSEGIEFVADWRPIDHLDLTLTYALDHTRIKSTCTSVPDATNPPPGCFLDGLDPNGNQPGARVVGGVPGSEYQTVQGNPLPQAPENKVAFNATYTIPFEPGNLILSGSFVWKDKSYASIFQRSYYEAPSWNQVDLRATWSGNHDKYEVVLYVKNLFNSLGYDAAAAGYDTQLPALLGGGASTVVNSYDLTPPRLYGVEVHYKF